MSLRQLAKVCRAPINPNPYRSSRLFQHAKGPRATWQRRSASTASTAIHARSLVTRLKNLLYGTVIAGTIVLGYLYVTDTRAGIHQWVVVPSLRWIYDDAEDAHKAGNRAIKTLYDFGLHPRERGLEKDGVEGEGTANRVEVFGHLLKNQIGTSAGIDKGAQIPDALFALGPAIVEVGGTTPFPQDGNPKPRVFRLPSQNAIINRYGLNSEGADVVAMRLRQRVRMFAHSVGLGLDEEAERLVLDGEANVPPGSLIPGKLLAVQIAKNKSTPEQDIEAVEKDYVYCVKQLGRYADIIVVNVSSPNTPGLRSLQRVEPLTKILTGVVNAAKETTRATKPAVMVKVSPDEDSVEQIGGICEAVWQSGVDGVIVGNTTNTRPSASVSGYDMPPHELALLKEQGGYSGPQLFEKTVSLVRAYRHTLDQGPNSVNAKDSQDSKSNTTDSSDIDSKLSRDSLQGNLISKEPSGKSEPLFQLPERHQSEASSSSISTPQSRPAAAPSKVIFATGGVTNGKQALDVIEAGASVAMVYTALVYGGVGTISRIKEEMVQSAKSNSKETR